MHCARPKRDVFFGYFFTISSLGVFRVGWNSFSTSAAFKRIYDQNMMSAVNIAAQPVCQKHNPATERFQPCVAALMTFHNGASEVILALNSNFADILW